MQRGEGGEFANGGGAGGDVEDEVFINNLTTLSCCSGFLHVH